MPGFACGKNTGCHTSLFLHECYKALVPGKVLLILIAASLFVVWWNPAEKLSYDSVDEVYYKEYMDKYYGPLTAKTTSFWMKKEQNTTDCQITLLTIWHREE